MQPKAFNSLLPVCLTSVFCWLVSTRTEVCVQRDLIMSVTVEIKGKQTLIFTYGTLKRGFANHPLLQDLIRTDDAVYLGSYLTVHELPLVCGPHGVPFLLNLPGSARHRVHGELYAVSDRALARIDELEGTTRCHYERLPIQVRSETEVDGGDGGGVVVEAEAYYAHRSYAEEMWRRNGRVGFSAFTEKEEKGYVKRGDRPKDRSFIEDIRLFVSSSSSPQL